MNKVLNFFYMHTEETLHSEKTPKRLKGDLDSVICHETNILTINKDSEKYLFFPVNKVHPNDNQFIPSRKACGFRGSTLLPIFELGVTSGDDPEKADMKIKANPYPVFQILAVLFLILFFGLSLISFLGGILALELQRIFVAIAMMAIPIFFIWLAFWLPYNRTMDKLRWLVTADLEEERIREAHLEDVLREYDRMAGIGEDAQK